MTLLTFLFKALVAVFLVGLIIGLVILFGGFISFNALLVYRSYVVLREEKEFNKEFKKKYGGDERK